MRVDDLVSGLADFVYQHRDANETFRWDKCPDVPKGYSQIGVFTPFAFEPDGAWRYFRAFKTGLAEKQLIEARIAEKNARVSDYRKAASVVWLLIVNDLFLGPGEVQVHPRDLATWTYGFAFDKVLLFFASARRIRRSYRAATAELIYWGNGRFLALWPRPAERIETKTGNFRRRGVHRPRPVKTGHFRGGVHRRCRRSPSRPCAECERV